MENSIEKNMKIAKAKRALREAKERLDKFNKLELYCVKKGFLKPGEHITFEQLNDLNFWQKIIEPLYDDHVEMKWLITKPTLEASEDDVLNIVDNAISSELI